MKIVFGKVVLTIHDVTSLANNGDSSIISKLIYKFTNLILTHNEFSKSEIIKITPNLKEHIYIIPHGNYMPFLDVKTDKIYSRKHLGIPQDKTVLLFFGMIKKVKGLEILLLSLKDVISDIL